MKKRLKKYDDSLRELHDNMKHKNSGIIVIPDEEEKEKPKDNMIEKMTENFPNLERGNTMQIEEA